MSSAAKALQLLSYFSTTRPEIGLSHFSRIAKRDKATTFRQIKALESMGFVEQNPLTKQYRLGPAVLHLAQVREETVPRKMSARGALKGLGDATGETAHTTLLSGTTLYALDDYEAPHHGIRAIVDILEFPLHATASGKVALAYGDEGLKKIALANLQKFTTATPTSEAELTDAMMHTRKTGFGHADQSFEAEIYGLAAPLFDHSGAFVGTVSVASVASRLTAQLQQTIKSELVIAARAITCGWGGTVPASVEAAWSSSLEHLPELETAC